MQKIVPHLWFDDQAEEAARYYVSIFKRGKIGTISRYGEGAAGISGRPKGSVMTVAFELDGQELIALNGGPMFTFSPAISLFVNCETQEEVDRLWKKLSDGGEAQPCGWLRDRYGVSWQLVPTILRELLVDTDPARSERVMTALLQMKKIDIRALQKAYEG